MLNRIFNDERQPSVEFCPWLVWHTVTLAIIPIISAAIEAY